MSNDRTSRLAVDNYDVLETLEVCFKDLSIMNTEEQVIFNM